MSFAKPVIKSKSAADQNGFINRPFLPRICRAILPIRTLFLSTPMTNGKNIIGVRLGLLITSYPKYVLLIVLLITGIAGIGLTRLQFNSDYRVYFKSDSPELLAFNEIQSTFSKTDNVLFIVSSRSGNLFTADSLKAIKELTDAAWRIPFSIRVDSLANYQRTTANQDQMNVANLIADANQLTDVQIADIKNVALNDPLLVNRLISKQGDVTGVNVTFQLPKENAAQTMDLMNQARDMARVLEAGNSDLKIYLSGMVVMNDAFIESVIHDGKILAPLMFIILILVLYVCVKNWSVIFATVLLVFLTLLSTLGIAGWLDWELTSTSIAAPTVILTVAVADCVHIAVSQLHCIAKGEARFAAMRESLRINFEPVFLTSLTTAVGFLSMNFSDSPPFRDLGNIVSLGVLIAWILALVFFPAILCVLPYKASLKSRGKPKFMPRLAEFVIRYKNKVILYLGVFTLLMLGFTPINQFNDEFIKYFDEAMDFRQGTDFLAEHMGGLYTLEVAIHADSEGGINDPVFLQKLDLFSVWLRQQPEVKHVNTLSEIYKRLNMNMHGDDPAYYKLPEERNLAAQYLLLYEMSLPYGLDLNDQVNISKSSVRTIATLANLSSIEMLELERKIKAWQLMNMPEVSMSMASPILMFAHVGKTNIGQMISGSMLAFVLISMMLIRAFRSLKLGLISLIPNLAPAAIAFGFWALIDGMIGLSLSVVMAMTLGIVVDDTVHFMSKYRRARIELGHGSEDAVRYAMSSVGQAMWVTTAVLVCGFLVLNLSHFTMNSTMGLMSALTIAVALIMDLLLLPALLIKLDSWSFNR